MIELRRDQLKRTVVSVDPAATSGEDSDDTGIIVAALGPCQPSVCVLAKEGVRCPGHGYVLGDYTCKLPPAGWARAAVQGYDDWDADIVVAETNNGGDMVGLTVRSVRNGINYKKLTATRGKHIRAEPVSALFEQGRGHLMGEFPELYDELTTWTPDSNWSPNRLDALVWAFWELKLVGGQGHAFLDYWRSQQAGTPEAIEAAKLQNELANLPRLGEVNPEDERPTCKCPAGQRRFFDGICVKCAGKPS